MRLSLLRGPTQPDPDCDMGTHHIQWAICPHVGTLVESDVAQVAYAFNSPMRCESEYQSTMTVTVESHDSSMTSISSFRSGTRS
jgi:alpha-mannosidase